MSDTIQARRRVLKQYEPLCYQIAYYLLQSEKEACRVCAETLLDIGSNLPFFRETAEVQQNLMKQAIMKRAVQHTISSRKNNRYNVKEESWNDYDHPVEHI